MNSESLPDRYCLMIDRYAEDLDTILATVRDRDRKLDKGSIFYRTQRGGEYVAGILR